MKKFLFSQLNFYYLIVEEEGVLEEDLDIQPNRGTVCSRMQAGSPTRWTGIYKMCECFLNLQGKIFVLNVSKDNHYYFNSQKYDLNFKQKCL